MIPQNHKKKLNVKMTNADIHPYTKDAHTYKQIDTYTHVDTKKATKTKYKQINNANIMHTNSFIIVCVLHL